MSDGPPQLGEIPQQSEISVPTLKSTMETNGSSAGNGPHPDSNASIENAKDSIYNSEVRSWPCWKGYSIWLRWLGISTGFKIACMIWTDLLKLTLDAQSALASIQNHPATQNATDAITNGQVRDPGPPSHWRMNTNHDRASFSCTRFMLIAHLVKGLLQSLWRTSMWRQHPNFATWQTRGLLRASKPQLANLWPVWKELPLISITPTDLRF